jgi:hypothetical protein
VPRSLAELQHGLAEVILGRRDPSRLDGVAVPRGVEIDRRIAVYADGYPARVEESLREAYPAITKILGDGSFHGLATRYLERVPADVRNLNCVGAGLPAFLESDLLASELPFLHDLARLEWAVVVCFHSERVERFDASRLAGWGPREWADAHVALQPGVSLVCSDWPLVALHEARNLERSEIDVDLVDRPDRVLVYRQLFDVVAESADELEATALARIRAGESLGSVTQALATAGADPERVLQLFTRWTGLGLVADCRLGH